MGPGAEGGGAAAAGRETRERGSPTLAVVVASMWLAVLVVGVAFGALVNDMGELYCEPVEGSSDYGDFAWSVLPPGPTCTFDASVHGFDGVRGPAPVMSVWLAALGVGAPVIVATLRRSGRSA